MKPPSSRRFVKRARSADDRRPRYEHRRQRDVLAWQAAHCLEVWTQGRFDLAVSHPILAEYEDAIARLALRCPAEVYERSPRPYEPPEDLLYEGMEQRKVNPCGCIYWHSESVFISGALSGWSVGRAATPTGKWNVWFGRLLLGELDPACLQFRALEPAAAESSGEQP
jgi:hypothetical protein